MCAAHDEYRCRSRALASITVRNAILSARSSCQLSPVQEVRGEKGRGPSVYASPGIRDQMRKYHNHVTVKTVTPFRLMRMALQRQRENVRSHYRAGSNLSVPHLMERKFSASVPNNKLR